MIDKAREIYPYIKNIRRTIHRHPELSFHEENTCRLIAGELEKEGIPYTVVAKTGILARIDSGASANDPVVLRADTDALPIVEKTPVEFASKNGAMHACGHDIHTSSLLGALILLNRNKHLFRGTVLGLFQPAEEYLPGGASMVLDEKVFESYSPKAFLALHVAPEIPTGQFGLREREYMSSSDEIKMTIAGTGGHGGLPDRLEDPVVAAANVIIGLQQIVSRNSRPGIPTVLSIGKVIAAGATNIIPNEVRLEGTLRTMDEKWRAQAKTRIREIVNGICAAYHVKAELNIKDGYPCLFNDPEITRICRQALCELAGEENVSELEQRTTSEDFGSFSQLYPSLMYRLGVGRRDGIPTSGLHSETFYPDEESLLYGMASLAVLAIRLSVL